MAAAYEIFTAAFLAKITSYDFLTLENRQEIVDGYARAACAQFKAVCRADPTENADDEIADIISDGMVVEWLKPHIYRADLFENVLTTRDFSAYSPAELLNRIRETYQMARDEFRRKIKEYSYNHADLGD
jgi:hypothetical protein